MAEATRRTITLTLAATAVLLMTLMPARAGAFFSFMSSNTGLSVSRGPYLPVYTRHPDFGEAAAKYGAPRSSHVHEGQDIFAPPGAPLIAIRDGIVVEVGNDGGRGNYVSLWSPSANQTYNYFHMMRPSKLRPGYEVVAGDELGRLGCSGSCDGYHLHFEIRRGRGGYGRSHNPLPLLRTLEPLVTNRYSGTRFAPGYKPVRAKSPGA